MDHIDWGLIRRQQEETYIANERWNQLSAAEKQHIIDANQAASRSYAEQRALSEHMTTDAKDRIPQLLERLRRAGNPGLVTRHGTYYPPQNWLQSKLDITPRGRPAELEPAWPIGNFGWRSKGVWETLPTGFTPSGHVVPMERAAFSDGAFLGGEGIVGGAGQWDDTTYAAPPLNASPPGPLDISSALGRLVSQLEAEGPDGG